MDPTHRNVITSNRALLMEKIAYHEISPLLVEHGLFTQAMVDDIEEPNTESEKLLLLLKALPTRGPKAFWAFVNLLVDKGQLEAAKIMDPSVAGATAAVTTNANNNNVDSSNRNMVDELPSCEVRVRKASTIKQGPNIYTMRAKPRGLYLIINNENFLIDPRTGSEVDVIKADRVFTQLGFRGSIKNNLNALQMHDQLKSFSERPEHQNGDASVVIVMTHGHKDVIFGLDMERLSTNIIYKLFNNIHCPALAGKPKMFFIQACRGGKIDYGARCQPEVVKTDASLDVPSGVDPLPAQSELNRRSIEDIIIIQPSAPDFVALRNEASGSWFISTLVDVLMERACFDHLTDIINEVDRRIQKRVGNAGQRQTTSVTITGFNKNLYFNPGL